MPRIVDCNKNELDLGNHVAFVSGGEIRTGKVIELTQKFSNTGTWKDGQFLPGPPTTQTFMKVESRPHPNHRASVFRTRYPERSMKLADEAAIEGIKQLVPFGRKGS